MDEYFDCRDCTAEEILSLLYEKLPRLGRERRKRKMVYVGATGDVAKRVREHRITPDKVLFCALTAHRRVAAKVEWLAREQGFNIGKVEWGGNGTNSFSRYVYAYKITKNSRQ